MPSRLYRYPHAVLAHADPFLRLLLSRGIRRRWAILWGYAKLRLLAAVAPNRTKPVRLFGQPVHFGAIRLLWPTFREVFVEDLYGQHIPSSAERIIDGGANIGLTTLYYKQAYPEAEVLCFEPDPSTFELLKRNLAGVSKVTLHEAALASDDGERTLYVRTDSPGHPGSSVSRVLRDAIEGRPNLNSISVSGVSLQAFLGAPVDILKLDIEGSEVAALESVRSELPRIGHVQMEYHYLSDNTLQDVLAILEGGGYDYWIESRNPIENAPGCAAMIYARRRHRAGQPA